jgi:L-serine dehydratase
MLAPLDMFTIGIGPSSSHTVGPMKCALRFLKILTQQQLLSQVTNLEVDVYGSLALTGDGHGTISAIVNGLCGESPHNIDSAIFFKNLHEVTKNSYIKLLKEVEIPFSIDNNIHVHKGTFLKQHPNGLKFVAYNNQQIISSETYFSIGGGFVLSEQEFKQPNINQLSQLPYKFNTASELLVLCKQHNLSIAQLVMRNYLVSTTKEQITTQILEICNVMRNAVLRGITTQGILPGKIGVERRACNLYKKLSVDANDKQNQRLLAMTFAIAVNEENANFGRIVTAPTNGSSGTIPGVLEYYIRFCSNVNEDKIVEFILTAGTIGVLYKLNASIAASEVGCQGEVGVSSSMASAALTAVLGGNVCQVLNAAEIAMEHSLGMTCDPVAGLVQIPCIERNGIAASKAIDIAHLVILEDRQGKVSLDEVIATMLQTGRDMHVNYKETSLGGLAINSVNC